MSRWSLDRWLIFAVLVAGTSLVQFVVGCGLAIYHYPGGDYRANLRPALVTHEYHWQHNWLSDLGRDRTWTGQKNAASAAYFNRSLIALGAGLAIFFLIFHRSSDESTWESTAIELCGLTASAGLIVLGFTPVDRLYLMHHVGLLLWIVPMPLMSIFFAISCFRSGGSLGLLTGIIATLLFVAISIAILAYALAGTRSGYVVQQKIVVAISLVWFAIVLLRVAATSIQIVHRSRQEWIDEQARQYSAKLMRRQRWIKD